MVTRIVVHPSTAGAASNRKRRNSTRLRACFFMVSPSFEKIDCVYATSKRERRRSLVLSGGRIKNMERDGVRIRSIRLCGRCFKIEMAEIRTQ